MGSECKTGRTPKLHRGFFTRLRYFRGHGIHSPFVYSLVCEVFYGGSRANRVRKESGKHGWVPACGNRKVAGADGVGKPCDYLNPSGDQGHAKSVRDDRKPPEGQDRAKYAGEVHAKSDGCSRAAEKMELFCGEDKVAEVGELYAILRRNGLKARDARRLRRFYEFCASETVSASDTVSKNGFSSDIFSKNGFSSDIFSKNGSRSGGVYVITPQERFEPGRVWGSPQTIFVVASPYACKQKLAGCLAVARTGERLTIDTRRFFIIFNHQRQPKQHFKI